MKDGTSKSVFSIFQGVKTFVNDIETGMALVRAVFSRVIMKDDVYSWKCTDYFCRGGRGIYEKDMVEFNTRRAIWYVICSENVVGG